MKEKRKLSKITNYFSSNIKEKRQRSAGEVECSSSESKNERCISASAGCESSNISACNVQETKQHVARETEYNSAESNNEENILHDSVISEIPNARKAEDNSAESNNEENILPDSVIGEIPNTRKAEDNSSESESDNEENILSDSDSVISEGQNAKKAEDNSSDSESDNEGNILTDNVIGETSVKNSCPEVTHARDICLNKRNVTHIFDDNEKLDILNHCWAPKENFEFPSRQFGRQNRKFCFSWLKTYKWLAYSHTEDSAYCKVCVVFSPNEVGMTSSQNTGLLVRCGYNNWKKAIEKFDKHQKLTYHCQASLMADNFINIMSHKKLPIDKSLDNSRVIQAAENRLMLKPIIETIILCGQQNLPLRGHRDYGKFDINNPPLKNEGNFRAFLRRQINAGDENLKKHFQFCKRNATYISWNIQNQIIEACNDIITEKIASEVNDSKYFSILADETTDISCVQQLTLCLRYVKRDVEVKYKIKEKFFSSSH